MALNVITHPDGTKEIVHNAPHNRIDTTIIVPSYAAVLEAIAYLKDTCNGEQCDAIDVLDRFIKTR